MDRGKPSKPERVSHLRINRIDHVGVTASHAAQVLCEIIDKTATIFRESRLRVRFAMRLSRRIGLAFPGSPVERGTAPGALIGPNRTSLRRPMPGGLRLHEVLRSVAARQPHRNCVVSYLEAGVCVYYKRSEHRDAQSSNRICRCGRGYPDSIYIVCIRRRTRSPRFSQPKGNRDDSLRAGILPKSGECAGLWKDVSHRLLSATRAAKSWLSRSVLPLPGEPVGRLTALDWLVSVAISIICVWNRHFYRFLLFLNGIKEAYMPS